MTVTVALISTSFAETVSPLTLLGGLSLLKRALLTAQRVGAETCYILADSQHTEDLQRSVIHDKRLTARIVWLTPQTTRSHDLPSGEGRCIVFSCDTLFRPALVHEMSQKAQDFNDSWLVRGGTNNATLRVVSFAALRMLVAGWAQKGSIPEDEADQLEVVSADQHFLHRLTQQDVLGEVEKAFLLTLENPRDGLVDTYLNRKFSRLLTRLFLRTPLTPNQITILSFLTGLFGASCFLLGSYGGSVVGAFLLQFSTVLDCVDGEVARVKMLESPFGEWLDITLDTVVHIAIFLGVGVAVWKQDAIAAAPLLGGLLAAAACISFPLITLAEKTEERGRIRGGWEDILLEKMVAGLTSRDYSLLVLWCALVGKLAWFLWAAAIGAQVFWVALTTLLWKAGRFRESPLSPPPSRVV